MISIHIKIFLFATCTGFNYVCKNQFDWMAYSLSSIICNQILQGVSWLRIQLWWWMFPLLDEVLLRSRCKFYENLMENWLVQKWLQFVISLDINYIVFHCRKNLKCENQVILDILLIIFICQRFNCWGTYGRSEDFKNLEREENSQKFGFWDFIFVELAKVIFSKYLKNLAKI